MTWKEESSKSLVIGKKKWLGFVPLQYVLGFKHGDHLYACYGICLEIVQ